MSRFRLGHRPALDGLRAVAIVSVIAFHYRGNAALGSRGGYLGVELFFVLSGFLITSLLYEEYEANGRIAIRAFYARRALRLLPALAAMLAAYVTWMLLLGPRSERNAIVHDALGAAFYYANWRRAFSANPVERGLGPTWSLSVEEQFYIVWPLLLIALLTLRRLRLAIAACGAMVIAEAVARALAWRSGTPLQRLWYGTGTHSDSILIGCLLALVLAAGVPRWLDRALRLLAVPATLLLVFGITALSNDDVVLSGGFTVAGLCSAIVLYNVVERRFLHRLLEHPVSRWVGKRSYGIYLWHVPFFVATSYYVADRHVVWLIATPLAFAIPAVSYAYLEQPCLRAKRRFSVSRAPVRPSERTTRDEPSAALA